MPEPELADHRLVVISSDTHVGPKTAIFKDYCPEKYRSAFDDYLNEHTAAKAAQHERFMTFLGREDAVSNSFTWNWQTEGHFDRDARLADMDRDGVAAEVIFHGSTNGESIPFVGGRPGSEIGFGRQPMTAEERELEAVGRHMYNQWLADFCAEDPVRHIGLCQIPAWDLALARDEVEWAHDHGLRGVNFPAPDASIPAYEDPAWEPFFATCAERGMVLNTHTAGAKPIEPVYKGPAFWGIFLMEQPWLSRRGMWHLTFSGVFDRHPALKLVLTELPGAWFRDTVREMDASYYNPGPGSITRSFVRRPPSEYMAENVFVGASFLSRMEAEMAVESGFDDRFMWGSDYPHPEGTWRYPEEGETIPLTRLAMANTFHELPEPSIRRMLSGNLIDCFGLDPEPLRAIADRIGPTMDELAAQPDLSLVPSGYTGSAFRSRGAYS